MAIHSSPEWRALARHAREVRKLHLRDLIEDPARSRRMRARHDGVLLDYSRQLATAETLRLLFDLARAAELKGRIRQMLSGQPINRTEHRSVLHTALRMDAEQSLVVDGRDVVPQVLEVRDQIHRFVNRVRSGKHLGASGQALTDVVSIGIGGSYLGPEFVAESLRTDPVSARAAAGRRLRFLANVDPIDVSRALDQLDPASTLVVIVSKTFTTAETMLNARTVRTWLTRHLGEQAVSRQMVAVSTNREAVRSFGIDPRNIFGFWDWVGGRYSVSSAVGLLPLSLHYGPGPLSAFLKGANNIDRHFHSAPLKQNLPVLLGLFGVWNSTFLGHCSRALLPYCQALLKLSPHIQQVDMESNGKGVNLEGRRLPFSTGEIDFGEPGTNGQHSFYQLLHQGRTVPADFIGFKRSQRPLQLKGEAISNHDELMSNFFAQPDALARGRTAAECRAEGIKTELIPHKVFPGNRPSNVLLLPVLDAYTTGQLLALYEHRSAVQGFVWGINSFDQMGVELGKQLAGKVRDQLARFRHSSNSPKYSDSSNRGKSRRERVRGFNPSTTALLEEYLRDDRARPGVR